MLLLGAGHGPDADFVTPLTVAVMVMLDPGWHPLIAPKEPE